MLVQSNQTTPHERKKRQIHQKEKYQENEWGDGGHAVDVDEGEHVGQVTLAGSDEAEPRRGHDVHAQATKGRHGYEDGHDPRHRPQHLVAHLQSSDQPIQTNIGRIRETVGVQCGPFVFRSSMELHRNLE